MAKRPEDNSKKGHQEEGERELKLIAQILQGCLYRGGRGGGGTTLLEAAMRSQEDANLAYCPSSM